MRWAKGGFMIDSNKFKEARKFMATTLSKDEGLYLGYKTNIAMFLYDNRKKYNLDNVADCNDIAARLIGLIFD